MSDTVLYQFTVETRGTLFAKFSSHVEVYQNRVQIERSGRVDSIPQQVTIYFDNISAINYTKDTDYLLSYISFTGMSQSTAQSIAGVGFGNMMMGSASANPWKDPYGIVFKLNLYEEGKTYYQELVQIFEEYKRSKSDSSASAGLSESPLDKLKKLKELYDAGIITDSEYEEKRKKLLAEI